MKSTLKIFVDVPCQVYCDYELKGNAVPNSLFKIEMRKGTYILEFKENECVLLSQEYKMESNEEEDLLKVSLANKKYNLEREKRFEEICRKEIIWFDTGDNWRIVSCNDEVLNIKTQESFIDLPHEYLLLPMAQHHNKSDIDECGLIPFNIGGTFWKEDDGSYVISGGKWGCLNKLGEIQIPAAYSQNVFFQNKYITDVYPDHLLSYINKFGEKISSKSFHYSTPLDNTEGYYKVQNSEGKYGAVDYLGKIVIPLVYDCLSYNSYNKNGFVWAKFNEKWGIIDFNGNIINLFIYDDVHLHLKTVSVRQNKEWGLVDLSGKVIVPIHYEILSVFEYNYPNCVWAARNYWSEDGCVLVRKKGKYGTLNTDISKHDENNRGEAVSEVIPCIYDAVYGCFGVILTDIDFQEFFPSDLENGHYGMDCGKGYACFFVNLVNSKLHCFQHDKNGIITKSFICDSYNSYYRRMDNKFIFFCDNENKEYDKVTEFKVHVGVLDNYEKRCYEKDFSSYFDAEIGDAHTIFGIPSNSNAQFQIIVSSLRYEQLKDFGRSVRFSYHYAIVQDKGKDILYLIEKDNTITKQFSAEEINYCSFYGNPENEFELPDYECFAIKQAGKWGVCIKDWNNINISPNIFDEINPITGIRIEVAQCIDGRKLFGLCEPNFYVSQEKVNCKFIRPYNYRRCNWVEIYDIHKKKEGIIIESYKEFSAETDPEYGDPIVVTEHPEAIVIPFIYDYVRILFGKAAQFLVIGKDVIYCNNKVTGKFAVANTNQKLLTDFIFDSIDYRGGNGVLQYDAAFRIGEVEAYIPLDSFTLKQEEDSQVLEANKIEYVVPLFLPFGHYDINNHKNSTWCLNSPFKKSILFFDTETTGLPLSQQASFTDQNNWPYLVQIGFILYDENIGKLAERNIIISPEGYSIPKESTEVHGITQEYAEKNGENRFNVLNYMDKILASVDTVVGHNVEFDINVLKCEILRVKKAKDALFMGKQHRILDTMKTGTDFCRIPSNGYGGKYKWPKLSELYQALFQRSFIGQHDAMNDIFATYECYWEMRKRNLINDLV